MHVLDFIKWGLTHVKKSSVPVGAILLAIMYGTAMIKDFARLLPVLMCWAKLCLMDRVQRKRMSDGYADLCRTEMFS